MGLIRPVCIAHAFIVIHVCVPQKTKLRSSARATAETVARMPQNEAFVCMRASAQTAALLGPGLRLRTARRHSESGPPLCYGGLDCVPPWPAMSLDARTANGAGPCLGSKVQIANRALMCPHPLSSMRALLPRVRGFRHASSSRARPAACATPVVPLAAGPRDHASYHWYCKPAAFALIYMRARLSRAAAPGSMLPSTVRPAVRAFPFEPLARAAAGWALRALRRYLVMPCVLRWNMTVKMVGEPKPAEPDELMHHDLYLRSFWVVEPAALHCLMKRPLLLLLMGPCPHSSLGGNYTCRRAWCMLHAT